MTPTEGAAPRADGEAGPTLNQNEPPQRIGKPAPRAWRPSITAHDFPTAHEIDGREGQRRSHREAHARKEAKARASPDTDPRRRAPGKEEDPKSERFVQKIARSVEGAGNDASDKSEAD